MSVALSPSRVSDFKTCPLLYRFRCVDRIPEVPSAAAVKGTLVHAVLEELYQLPLGQRCADRAVMLVAPVWAALCEKDPQLVQVCEPDEAAWLDAARGIVRQYFVVEDPQCLEPEALEKRLDVTLPSGLRLRGIVDRIDVAPDGRVRIVDYKTGRIPSGQFEAKTLFQLKFYALMWWRLHGVIPAMLRLIYVAEQQILEYTPSVEQLEATQSSVEAVHDAITRCVEQKEFPATPSALCRWCPHQKLCPAQGGEAPPYP